MSLVAEALELSDRLAPARADVEVVSTGPEGWQVSLRAPFDRPFALLGFITLLDGRYRVCAIGRPCGEIQTATLAEAIDALRPAAA